MAANERSSSTIRPISFGRFVFMMTMSGGAFFLAVLALVGLALAMPIRRLVLPWMLLVWVSFVMGILIYWARAPFDKPAPRSTLKRATLATFVIFSIYGGAIVVSIRLLGIVSREQALAEYAPLVIPCAAIGAGGAYLATRSMFQKRDG